MFRKCLTIAAAAAVALFAPGCTTLPDGTKTIDPKVLQDAQTVSQAICSFLPTAETVANIAAVGNPLLLTGEQIGNAICAEVTKANPPAPTPSTTTTPSSSVPMARRAAAAPAIVAGVIVDGRFVH